jgi:hypothetical protein
MRTLSSQEFALAVFMSVCERKSRERLRERQRTLIIDECLELFEDPRLSPVARRFSAANIDEIDREHREMCASTLALFESIAPLVRIMATEQFTQRHRRRA